MTSPSPTGQATFDSMTGAALHAVVDTAYQETSRHLLQVLNTKYNFMEHLKVSLWPVHQV